MPTGRDAHSPLPANDLDQLRLIVKVAHLYHQRRLTQPLIAAQLRISQARVSRLLKTAEERGIVRTTVHVPPGLFTELEDALEQRYRLGQVMVVDTGEAGDDEIIPALGARAATLLEEIVPTAKIVGISSWSETLLAAVEAMHPVSHGATKFVVQTLGGVGRSDAQVYATRLTERLAQVCRATPVFLLGPGVVVSGSVRQALLRDPHFAETLAFYDRLDLVLTGIGSVASPSRVLRESAVGAEDRRRLRAAGAVGDICLRFFDADGRPVASPLDDRVLAMTLEQLRKTPRTVAVAGGRSKFAAIRAALRGRWVDTLLVDVGVARRLLDEP